MARIKTGRSNWKGRSPTVDLLFKIACFVKNKKIFFSVLKATDLN
jgi:hypothetical protein